MTKKLLSFLGIGLAILLLDIWFDSSNSYNTIVLHDDEINGLIKTWMAQVGRLPTDQDLKGIINQLVEEEILYREALKLNLDKDDIIIKRRLAQKIGFLKQEEQNQPPTESELKTYFESKESNYYMEKRFSFTHLYYSKDKNGSERAAQALQVINQLMPKEIKIRRGDTLNGIARMFDTSVEELAKLNNIKDVDKIYASNALKIPQTDIPDSDPFLVGKNFINKTDKEIDRDFGKGFSSNFSQSTKGLWLGPFNSIYGDHLIKISNIVEAKKPDYKEVKKTVLMDYWLDTKQESMKNYIEDLKKDYEIQINPKFNYQD